jgi:hypothetical protein
MVECILADYLRIEIALTFYARLFISQWYNPLMLTELQLGDVIKMRKPHPCGGYLWKVIRLGADIGLICLTCERRVMLTRRELAHRMKSIVEHNPSTDENPGC